MTSNCVVDAPRIWRAQCHDRQSLAHPPIPRHRHLSGLGPRRISPVRSTKSAASRNAGIGVCELCEAAIVMLMRCKGQLKPKPSLFTKQEAESSFERSDAEGGSSRQRGYCC